MENMTCVCTDDCALGFNPACECEHEECGCRTIANMIGEQKAKVFDALCEYLDDTYEMDKTWRRQKTKTKKWKYEYKFARGGKTLCGFYITDDCLGLLIIFGQKERELIEERRHEFSPELLKCYDETKTYHDGKWMMVELEDLTLLEDIKKLLQIKRKPNKR